MRVSLAAALPEGGQAGVEGDDVVTGLLIARRFGEFVLSCGRAAGRRCPTGNARKIGGTARQAAGSERVEVDADAARSHGSCELLLSDHYTRRTRSRWPPSAPRTCVSSRRPPVRGAEDAGRSPRPAVESQPGPAYSLGSDSRRSEIRARCRCRAPRVRHCFELGWGSRRPRTEVVIIRTARSRQSRGCFMPGRSIHQ